MISRIIRFLQSKGLWATPQNIGRRYSTNRFVMYNSIEKFIQSHKLGKKILIISEENEHSIRNMLTPNSKTTNTNYPEVDIMDLSSFRQNSFDVVITDQVLEHVPNPFEACKQIHRVLKRGGITINTSCSFNPIHDQPDFFRFTKNGFAQIHKIFDKVYLLESWGNKWVIGRFALLGYKSFDIKKWPWETILATHNEILWPWSIWCVAQK
ncbi:methyltransferase domain-containing protein [Candidatus Gottesmanbacteria bacterium]|nr:methyltransferase domain-containing protein [Candidatus Gottesmanbacteria bacterium]